MLDELETPAPPAAPLFGASGGLSLQELGWRLPTLLAQPVGWPHAARPEEVATRVPRTRRWWPSFEAENAQQLQQQQQHCQQQQQQFHEQEADAASRPAAPSNGGSWRQDNSQDHTTSLTAATFTGDGDGDDDGHAQLQLLLAELMLDNGHGDDKGGSRSSSINRPPVYAAGDDDSGNGSTEQGANLAALSGSGSDSGGETMFGWLPAVHDKSVVACGATGSPPRWPCSRLSATAFSHLQQQQQEYTKQQQHYQQQDQKQQQQQQHQQQGEAAAQHDAVGPTEGEQHDESQRLHFAGIFLDNDSAALLLLAVPPAHDIIHADHVTLRYEPDASAALLLPLGERVQVAVKLAAADTRAQVAQCALPRWLPVDTGQQPHVTVSVAPGVPPSESGPLLRRATFGGLPAGGVAPVDPPLLLAGRVGIRMRDGAVVFCAQQLYSHAYYAREALEAAEQHRLDHRHQQLQQRNSPRHVQHVKLATPSKRRVVGYGGGGSPDSAPHTGSSPAPHHTPCILRVMRAARRTYTPGAGAGTHSPYRQVCTLACFGVRWGVAVALRQTRGFLHSALPLDP